jgi:hypothetical protein
MICPLTGEPHRLLWLRSALWCQDCQQKIETCCEGDCPSSAALADGSAGEERAKVLLGRTMRDGPEPA